MSLGKIYISGKISGLKPDAVRDKFAAAESRLRALGYDTVNPLDNGLGAEEPWAAHMAMDISLLTNCGSIYMLYDWQDSRGAQVEYYIARVQGKAIIYEDTPTMELIIDAVESVFGVQFNNLCDKDRKQNFCFARTVFAGVAYELGFTPSEIGVQIRRDRSTVIYYIHQYNNGIDHSPRFARMAESVRSRVAQALNTNDHDKHRL